MQCQFKDLYAKGRKKKNNNFVGVKCTRTATWIVRKDGQEIWACDTHKTEGFLVRRIQSK